MLNSNILILVDDIKIFVESLTSTYSVIFFFRLFTEKYENDNNSLHSDRDRSMINYYYRRLTLYGWQLR